MPLESRRSNGTICAEQRRKWSYLHICDRKYSLIGAAKRQHN